MIEEKIVNCLNSIIKNQWLSGLNLTINLKNSFIFVLSCIFLIVGRMYFSTSEGSISLKALRI